MKICNIVWVVLLTIVTISCQGGKTIGEADEGDTLQMKYAQLLTLVKHADGAYVEAIVANPWKLGTVLHRYILAPKGEEGDKVVASLHLSGAVDVVRTPVTSTIVFTAPHCQLLYELGCKDAIAGVCDKDYINIPDVRNRVEQGCGSKVRKTMGSIMDCGSSMQPDIERIIALKPQALFISPFENSGGYGKLDKLHIPIIETADYMETSPLGRAEWMKFYGMLFAAANTASCGEKADSLFAAVERNYLQLKAEAAKLSKGLSVLTERKMGSVWYVPGGKSTIGMLLRDANAHYIFADDSHSGSLSLSPEQIVAKGDKVDVWAFKYFGGKELSRSDLLQEYKGYEALAAFRSANIYEADTSTQPYFELTTFHPEVLLREFIILSHPAASHLGQLRFYHKIKR